MNKLERLLDLGCSINLSQQGGQVVAACETREGKLFMEFGTRADDVIDRCWKRVARPGMGRQGSGVLTAYWG